MKSVVEQRIAFLLGRKVLIRVSWSADLIRAEVVALLSLGRDYQLHLVVDGRPRLISLRAILEIAEAP